MEMEGRWNKSRNGKICIH